MDEFRCLADLNMDGKVDALERALFFHMMDEEDHEIARSLGDDNAYDLDCDYEEDDGSF